MKKVDSKATGCSNQPGPISWQSVPEFIQKALAAQGCVLLRHRQQRPLLAHIRFQYTPFSYEGALYYLQCWSHDEWGVSPSPIIFPSEGSCSFDELNNGSLLSLTVKKAVAKSYGIFPDNSPSTPPSPTKQYDDRLLPLAG